MRFCPMRFAVNTAPAGSAIACVALGVVLTFPHAPQVWLPYKHTPGLVVPVPNSLVGTRPDTRSAFVASPVSTYCFGAACNAATGLPLDVSGPVIDPPATGTKLPAPTLLTALSTYPLFATAPEFAGVGVFGTAVKLFVPVIVSAVARCTTALSFAFPASAVLTYCIETGCAAVPDPGVVRTVARFAGDVVGTSQYSVRVVPSFSW